MNNTYFKEIQVPNINEGKSLKKERTEIVKEIYNSFWQKICTKFHYEYNEEYEKIRIQAKDVDGIVYLAANFYLEEPILQRLEDFKVKNDKLRSLRIKKDNKYFKLEFLRYFKDI